MLTRTLDSFPDGDAPIQDGRFATTDIRLSSALCCLGFILKLEAQPVAVTLDADARRKIVTFFHEDNSQHPGLVKISARDVDLWWRSPEGKYSIEGYDDALTAIRRVFEEREEMISIAKNPRLHEKSQFAGRVATKSLHTASILRACEIKLIGYESRTRKWIFGKGAEVIADLVGKGGKPASRPLENDLCIDWMLGSLRYRDWLARMVKDPDCIPLIEMREGKRILQISSGMDEREQRKWISYL